MTESTQILRVVQPKTERGNDGADHIDDPEYFAEVHARIENACSAGVADDLVGDVKSIGTTIEFPDGATSMQEEWPDLAIPGSIEVPEIPADLLPGIAGQMADAVARSTQTPPTAAVMCALSVLATCVQRKFEISPFGDEYTESLSLWTLTALPSGARKTAVINLLAKPLLKYELQEAIRLKPEIARVQSARMVAKKRIEVLSQQASKEEDAEKREEIRQRIQQEELDMPPELRSPRLLTGDCTPERVQSLIAEHGERMAVLSDESGILHIMAGHYSGGVANIDTFLQAYSGSPVRVDRAGRQAHINRPALSMGLMLQPGILVESAGRKRFRDSGLLARFLYAIPKSNVGSRDVRRRDPIPEDILKAREDLLMHLLTMGTERSQDAKPWTLRLEESASDHALDFAEWIERSQGPGAQLESIQDWLSKLPGTAYRLASIFQILVSRGEANMVEGDAMRRAVALCRLLIGHAQAAFRMLGADEVEFHAQVVLRWIRRNSKHGFTQHEAHKALEGTFRKVDTLVEALKRLQEWQVVSAPTEFRNHGARRSSVHFSVNPKLFVDKP